jgi:hypothetical protein
LTGRVFLVGLLFGTFADYGAIAWQFPKRRLAQHHFAELSSRKIAAIIEVPEFAIRQALRGVKNGTAV